MRSLRFCLSAAVAASFLAGCTGTPPYGSLGTISPTEGEPHILWKAIATLRPREGEIGNGFAEVTFNDREDVALNLRANLIPLEGEERYAVFLLSGTSPAVNAGRPVSLKPDGTYVLNVTHHAGDLQPYLDYRRVVVARVPSGSPGTSVPEKGLVLEGELISVSGDEQ